MNDFVQHVTLFVTTFIKLFAIGIAALIVIVTPFIVAFLIWRIMPMSYDIRYYCNKFKNMFKKAHKLDK